MAFSPNARRKPIHEVITAEMRVRRERLLKVQEATDVIDTLCTAYFPTYPDGYGRALSDVRLALMR